jgi:hypothetical protein
MKIRIEVESILYTSNIFSTRDLNIRKYYPTQDYESDYCSLRYPYIQFESDEEKIRISEKYSIDKLFTSMIIKVIKI